MSLLREIQETVIAGNADIGPVLFKLRLLASRLGSDPLEDWVRHELDGYPPAIEIPDYRQIGVSISASFSGPFGSGINNAPIPSILVDEVAGEGWTRKGMRDSISSIDKMISDRNSETHIHLDYSNLMMVFQGKIYEDMACNQVRGIVALSSMVEIQNAVRGRVLELTIQLEKAIPDSVSITIRQPFESQASGEIETVTQITKNIVYGDMTSINNTGSIETLNTNVRPGNHDDLMNYLTLSGLPEEDAEQLVKIAESEKPDDEIEPLGPKARKWLAEKIKKGVGGAWKMTSSIATSVISKGLMKYYGLS